MKKLLVVYYVILSFFGGLVMANASIVYLEDFDPGPGTFGTEYTEWPVGMDPADPVTNPLDAQEYAIDTSPVNVHSGFANYFDHTSGTGDGNMMILNGALSTREWYDTVSVISGQLYRFSVWASTAEQRNPAILELKIDGTTLGSSFTLSSQLGLWQEISP